MTGVSETELVAPEASRRDGSQAAEPSGEDPGPSQRETRPDTGRQSSVLDNEPKPTVSVSRRTSSPMTPAKATSSTGSYNDHAPFSPMVLSPSYYDDYGGDFVIYNRMPLKEICLAIALLTLGTMGIVFGAYMAYNKVWGDRSHGLIFFFLGALLFIPGFHETRIAYFAWIGYKGFSFGNIPSV